MANLNQGYRSGNAFGRLADISNEAIFSQGIKLEPGYLIRLRSRMHLVTAVEPISVDCFFTDTVNVGNASAATLNGTDATPLMQYGGQSIQAYYDITDSDSAANLTGNILKPDFDSGHITFDDLEPFKGNLYQLCPTLPLQPKFMVGDTGDWHSLSDDSPNEGGTPIGFKGDGTVAIKRGEQSETVKVPTLTPDGYDSNYTLGTTTKPETGMEADVERDEKMYRTFITKFYSNPDNYKEMPLQKQLELIAPFMESLLARAEQQIENDQRPNEFYDFINNFNY